MKNKMPKCTSNKKCKERAVFSLYHQCDLPTCKNDKTTIHYCPAHFLSMANQAVVTALFETVVAVEMAVGAKKVD